jgi:orotidine-5'-phosphate decarboxylase
MPVTSPTAAEKLAEIQRRIGSVLSAGLEPCAEYLPRGFEPTIRGYEAALRTLIDATAGLVCAYKPNLAFFESLGPEGWALLKRVRDAVPRDVLFIADAKRGDIGSTAQQYAKSVFEWLDADAVTLNPLMGRDSAAPFLAYRNKLSFFLVLTSNPGAADFLLEGSLYRRIATSVAEWNRDAGNCGMVVGATRAEQIAEIRAIAPGVPFLVPGLGAQQGELESTARLGRATAGDGPGLIFHVTRGLLPTPDDSGAPAEVIRAKAADWNRRTWAAIEEGTA